MKKRLNLCRPVVLKVFCIALNACLFTACGNSENAATDTVRGDTTREILPPKEPVANPQLHSGNADSIPPLDTQGMRETLKVLDSLQQLKKK